jgi:hypothetical protein
MVVMTHVAGAPFEHQLKTVDVGGIAMMRHEESGVLFLPHSHGFRAGQVYRYDPQGHDISVRYTAGTSAVVSIYVLPFAFPRSAEQFRDVFETSIADMLSNVPVYTTLDDRRTAFAHAAAGMGIVHGRRCEVAGQVQMGSSRLDCSLVEVFVFRAWLLKIRATCQVASRLDLELFLGAWLAASLPRNR